MNINIISRENKPMLCREEAIAEVDFVGAATPSRQKLQEEFAKLLEKDIKLVVVKKIQTHFGRGGAKVTVYAYSDEKDLKKIEPKEKKKKGEQAPAEAKKEEAKPEEKKEHKKEKKEEAKPEEKKEHKKEGGEKKAGKKE
jgi:ribosomal protein S24E